MIDPVVLVEGDVAVLRFNLANYDKPSGSSGETVLARWNATEVYREIDGAWRIVLTPSPSTEPRLQGSEPE